MEPDPQVAKTPRSPKTVAHPATAETTPAEGGVERHRIESVPLLFVTRYCGLEPSSITAAIHEGLTVLDRHLNKLGAGIPDDVIVIYRNRFDDSVTVDVGYVVAPELAHEEAGEIKAGHSPGGVMLSRLPAEGLHGVFDAHEHLRRTAQLAGLAPADLLWQRFATSAVHDLPHKPVVKAYLPVS